MGLNPVRLDARHRAADDRRQEIANRRMATYVLSWQDLPPAECRGGAVAIGNFDGVHRGHAALLAELRRQAEAVSGPAVALTFEPHPLQLLKPDQFMPVLTAVADRAETLLAGGAEHVVVLRTDRALLQLSAADFFEGVIRARLAARALVEGNSFRFGRDREGNIATLTSLCQQAGLGMVVVPPLLAAGVPVSSSRARSCLLRGAVREAADLLGRPYRLRGTVGAGQRRGQALGFPTANLGEIKTVVPGDGVYAVRVQHDARSWPGAANIGPNPTFGEQTRKVEAHLIGFQGDLYGQWLAVDFIDRLRDTRPFSGAGALVEQLKRDIEDARRLVDQPN
jgi:riboflavin kinase/FMN adenylyltransferase